MLYIIIQQRKKIRTLKNIAVVLGALFLFSCSGPQKEKADLIVHHALVYTIDSSFSTAECFAVKDGKIIAVGTNDSILARYDGEKLDAQGKAVFPGLIDAHCHFYGYGLGLQKVDLVDTKSFDEVIQKVVEFSKTKKGEWILGRGWDQNDWAVKEYPDRAKLDSLFPNTPVFLKRVDGHAALVNGEALRRAGITEWKRIAGGEMGARINLKDMDIAKLEFKYLSGILIDNAVDLVANKIPTASRPEAVAALLAAQKDCFAVGLTTLDDAGLDKQTIDLMDELQKSGELKMRIYAMLTDSKENLDYYLNQGPYKTARLNVRSFKFYADGALGSRGACLLKSYSDKPQQQGFLLSKPEYFAEMAKKMFDKGFQMNTHCIGDSATRFLINTYGHCFMEAKYEKMDSRWRIEHFQVSTKEDIALLTHFNSTEFNLIPSVQPTHATSDMYWAKDRLGPDRVKYAYAYKDQLKAALKCE